MRNLSINLLAQKLKEKDIKYLKQENEKILINLALGCLEKNLKSKDITLHGNFEAQEYLKLQLANEEQEIFGVLFMDNKNRVITFEKLFFGSINTAPIYERIIIKRALELNCSAVIVAHNHPSNDPSPSEPDIEATQALKKILKIVDVELLDHIIITAKECKSLAALTGI